MLARNGRLVAGTAECTAACCGVDGFYRAFPCASGVGCGGGEAGEPVFIPRNYTCVPDGTLPAGRRVIGFDRACWEVEPDVWQLCDPANPAPPTINCIPPGSRVLPPGFPVACLDSCQNADCLDSRPRWITIYPCDASYWPPPEHPEWTLPIVPALGFPQGCIVGQDANLKCWKADCANVFAAWPDEIPENTPIFTEGIFFAYKDCCACECGGGQIAELGCDVQYPPPALQPVNCCCPPELNDGATLEIDTRETVDGYVSPGYRATITTRTVGSFSISGGLVVGSGTITTTTRYFPGLQCPGLPGCPPGIGCVEEVVSPMGIPPFPWCPVPLFDARPCPGTPNVTWVGGRNCQGSYSRRIYTNPNPPTCPAFAGGTISIDREGRYTLTGVDYGNCSGGCGSGSVFSPGMLEISERPSGLAVASRSISVARPTSGGCSSCGGRGL